MQGLLKKNCLGHYEAKTDYVQFQNVIKNVDILCLTETWTCDDNVNNVNIEGFELFYSHRQEKHKKAKRDYGGVIIFVKKNLVAGISKQRSIHDDFLWLKLDRKYFNLQKDIFMCTAYLLPENSSIFSWKMLISSTSWNRTLINMQSQGR